MKVDRDRFMDQGYLILRNVIPPDKLDVDDLQQRDVPFKDTLRSHVEEHRMFRGSPEEYVARD